MTITSDRVLLHSELHLDNSRLVNMSLLPAEVNAQLAQLLQQLQSADNNVRSQAEDVLQNQWTSQRPEWLLMGLAEQIATSTSSSVCRPTSPSPKPRCC